MRRVYYKKNNSSTSNISVAKLNINRFFTEENKHPYNNVKWILTKAEIPNTEFKMENVEFPDFYSQNAVNIITSKYFKVNRGKQETSLKELIDRVVKTFKKWGLEQGYFDERGAEIYENELTYILLHQYAAFNSPVWFNVGVEGRKGQCSACFILDVEDSMESILDWIKTEGMIFKGGSGAGVNLSKLRAKGEKLSTGGVSSGVISFMKAADTVAGSIKSGGTTRRAAKMVILNVDHPEIMDFIKVKAEEENKVRALMEAGYDMTDLNNPLWQNIFFQNANNSIRVTDEFMRAVLEDKEWKTYNRTDGKVNKVYKAKKILLEAAKAAWECGDPGIQFHDIINRWHTCKNSGEIVATNPCVTGDTLVATKEGWRRIKDLVGKNPEIIILNGVKKAVKVWQTGVKPVYRIITKCGYELKATADHPIYIEGKGDVLVKDLQKGDKVVLKGADWGSENLDPDIAFMVGYFVGKSSTGQLVENDCLANIYVSLSSSSRVNSSRSQLGSLDAPVWPSLTLRLKHSPTAYPNLARRSCEHSAGTSLGKQNLFFQSLSQLRQYGIIEKYFDYKHKIFKDPIFNLDKTSIKYILQGLFTADGTISGNSQKGFYVGLDNSSLELLKQVQLLLLNFGIKSKLYVNRRRNLKAILPDSRREPKVYKVKQMHSLRITRSSRIIFEKEIGFYFQTSKNEKLQKINESHETYKDHLVDEIKEIVYEGIEPVYDLTEPATNHFVANGILVHNCSEYNFLNWTSCNLASINLMKFLKNDRSFDVEAFKHTVRIIFLSQDILISKADYPHPKITEETKKYRTIGLGYTNLGALIMALGLPYDSDEARALAASITSLITGYAYKISTEISEVLGPFPEYEKNKKPMLEVMKMHRDESYKVPVTKENKNIIESANKIWNEVIERGEKYGFRNAQTSTLAPTGTISFMLDCDTTGIEPDFALVKMKQLVGGGWMKIVNKTVPLALKKLGYSEKEIEDIVKHLEETQNIESAPYLKLEHLPIFDTSVPPPGGKRFISLEGHIKMVAAVQPFISGGISKTFNMPNSATVEDVYNAFIEAWKFGIKCFAIYRDGSKATQALFTNVKKSQSIKRKKLPIVRQSETHKFSVAGHEGYLTYSFFEDGSLGEIFIRMSKQGSTLAGLLDAFAISISIALQYGVPLKDLANKFIHLRFEPMGLTENPKIKFTSSIVDYIFKYLSYRFLSPDDLKRLGLEIKDEEYLKDHPKLFNNNLLHKTPINNDLSGPPCKYCGGMTTRTGSCYTCLECGESSGGCS